MNTFRKRVSQVHGTFLIVLTAALFTYMLTLPYTGIGPYAFLKDNFWAVGGFTQAYMLMCFIGISLVVGSRQNSSGVWNWIGALPHWIFLVLYIFNLQELYDGLQNVLIGTFILHSTWAIIETVAALGIVRFGEKSGVLVS
jgi:hypothetical protein